MCQSLSDHPILKWCFEDGLVWDEPVSQSECSILEL